MSERMETRKDMAAELSGTCEGRRIHMIGVGGAGMRALAAMLLDRGAVVSGSDLAPGAAVTSLRERGAAIEIGQRPRNVPVDCDLVVHSAAIAEQNPELVAARRQNVEIVKYSRMLGMLMSQRVGIAVAGTHGKSTTTAMVAYVLSRAGADPSYIIGAIVEQLGGPSGVGRGRHFVAEACEFDRSFLNLHPQYAAILNIEEDHLDCFENLAEIVEAFRAFASQVKPDGLIVANGESRDTMDAVGSARAEVQTFGLTRGCSWRGDSVVSDRGLRSMDVVFEGRRFCRLRVPLAGLHNAYNALAATALLHHAGVDGESIAKLLSGFTGAYRRATLKGRSRGVTVVDDYAHHPTEVQASLHALREFYSPKRLLCVFQPHQHSRTRFLLKDFAQSFGACDEVIVPDIYFVRDSARERDYISSADLVAQIRFHGGVAEYRKTFDEIIGHLQDELTAGDLVVTMGAGNIWEVADEIVRWLGRDS